MGRIEKKFQKKKDREREVRKKILRKRAVSRAFTKQMQERGKLEKSLSKATKPSPIRRTSPELEKTLELVEKIKAEEKENPDVDRSDDSPTQIRESPSSLTALTCK